MVHQTTCVALDSSSYFRNNAPDDQGHDLTIANSWSIAQWIKGVTNSVFQTTFGVGSGANDIRFTATTANGEGIVIRLWDKEGVEFYNATFYPPSASLTEDVWHHIVLTWDGFSSSIVCFIDGVAAVVDSESINLLPAAMVSSLREVKIANAGGPSGGKYFSTAVWDVALDGFDVTSLYNGGNGYIVDLVASSGTYTKAGHLRHWWRHGFETGNIGKDFGTNFNLINIMDDASGVDGSDVVNDYPGM